MRIDKYALGLAIIFCIFSCSNSVKAKFEITNNSSIVIDSLSIEPNCKSDKKFISIKPSEVKTYLSNMTDIAKTDGDYLLSFKSNNKVVKKKFGYFTNGYPLETLIKINIMKDTIIFDFKN